MSGGSRLPFRGREEEDDEETLVIFVKLSTTIIHVLRFLIYLIVQVSPEEPEGPTNTVQFTNRFVFPSITSWWENLHKGKAVTVLILVYVNLINYMDRSTVAGMLEHIKQDKDFKRCFTLFQEKLGDRKTPVMLNRRDGLVSFEEANNSINATIEEFAEIDTNKDGFVHPAEFDESLI